MTTPRPSPVPESVHHLPHPRRPIDPAHEPFVGNTSPDDNLSEAVQVAIWNALGRPDHPVEVAVEEGVVTLTGEVADEAQCAACELATAAVVGVREVRSRMRPGTGRPRSTGAPAEPWTATAEPLARLTRYCGATEASVSAAIRDGVATLDAALAAHGIPNPDHLILVYRNRHAGTLTLEIGMPVPPGVAVSDDLAGSSPAGLMMSTSVGEGIEELQAGIDRLHASIRAAGYEPAEESWQRFEAGSFRPWATHPAATVTVALERR